MGFTQEWLEPVSTNARYGPGTVGFVNGASDEHRLLPKPEGDLEADAMGARLVVSFEKGYQFSDSTRSGSSCLTPPSISVR